MNHFIIICWLEQWIKWLKICNFSIPFSKFISKVLEVWGFVITFHGNAKSCTNFNHGITSKYAKWQNSLEEDEAGNQWEIRITRVLPYLNSGTIKLLTFS